MPRQPRRHSQSGIYHIMIRGIDRQNIFQEDEDRKRLIETLKYYKSISQFEIYAYCIMNNHVHLLIKEVEESISKIMKRVNVSYSIWYNQKYERYGYLFQDRFKSEPVDDDKYFYTVFRYIHQNPLKAKIVNDVKNWKWSSFSEYFNQPSFVDTDFILDMLSEDKKEALERLRSYLSEANDDTCLEYEEKLKISDDEVKLIFVKFGIKNIGELHKSEKKKSDELIKKVKDVKGISIRQLARVTGISKSVIGRI